MTKDFGQALRPISNNQVITVDGEKVETLTANS
jgi:hypothetical protein